MRHLHRLGLLGLLAAGLALLSFAPPARLSAQQRLLPAQPGAGPSEDPNAPKPEAYQSFTFPEDRDAKQRLKAVMDYLDKKTVPWDVVCGTSQQLLDAKSDSFFPLDEAAAGGKATGSRVSIKTKVNDLIGNFPKEGRQFYELTYGPTADAILKDAVQNRYDKPALADVSQRYFHTKAGAQATLLLATLDLETGNYAEAAYGFQRLLGRPESDDVLTPRTLFKAAVAFKRSGDPRQAEAVAQLWDRLTKTYPRDGLAFGRKTYTLDDLKRELDRAVDTGFGQLGDDVVAMRYGNPSHTGRGEGGTPFLDQSFGQSLISRHDDKRADGAEWVRQSIDGAFKSLDRSKGQVAIPGFFPVTAPGLILFRTYDEVYAVVTKDGFAANGYTYRAGELFWRSYHTFGGAQSLMSSDDTGTRGTVQTWWSSFWQHRMPNILFENAQVGTLSHDGKLVYFVDDLAIPPLPQLFNPNMGGFQAQQQMGFAGNQVRGMTEHNRLVALELETGRMNWDLGGIAATALTEQDEEKVTDAGRLTENAYFLGPPLPLNGKLYVLFERNNQVKLACLDPHKTVPRPKGGGRWPELVWTQNLGSPNTRLGQDSNRRVQPAFLTYADGVLICPTNSGAVVAVDVNARSLLWARYYGASLPGSPMLGEGQGGVRMLGGRGRAINDPNALTLPQDRWRAAAPIITGGKVVLTAHDSEQLQCLDLRTGELLWSAPRQKEDLYVGGVIGDKVVVVGKESVRAYTLAGGAKKEAVAAWPAVRIGTPCGHGVASKDGLYYVPVVGNPDQTDSKDPAVWAVEVATGRVRSKTEFRRKPAPDRDPRTVLGNLVFHDGQLFAQSATDFSAFPLSELKKAEMTQRLAANPNDPEGLFARGELSLDDGQFKEAVTDFKKAEKNNPSDVTRRRIREKLYVAYTELLRNKFADGEPFLKEYEALCELPVDTDDPVEKQRLMDEQVRRRGLYLSLVAKGREKQGRLVEAFDAYRAFAALGDNKQLVPIYDEANGLTRPDVWARGRIDAMIRATSDPAARKPLEERVVRDWESIRIANDLDRLREFVKVFGPYFAVGRDAQLLLAERLLQTNNEDDLRAAQTQLMQLWATAEDHAVEARAVEMLARVMTRRGMLEDAVSLFAQLGTRYADVPVRDGKTGADVYGELVTDKRLLPYLEPGRGPAAGKYKVEAIAGNQNRAVYQTYSVRPDGDLFPFFRRFDLTLEPSNVGAANGEMQYHLRVTDKATGEERCRFNNLTGIQPILNRGLAVPYDRLARANGHLLLVTAGAFAYCFDLAEKRELWRQTLLSVPAVPNPNLQADATPDGDVEFTYDDGWKLRLGSSSVLQPTYACVVTQDGLTAFEPATGQRLWVRPMSKKVQVFGDAKYVFVVDGSVSRVLRAVDGTPVEGVKEFAALATGPARVGVFGRHILLHEGDDGKPRVLRLYDPLTGQDVWRKEYPAKALFLKTFDRDLTGCLTPDGKFEILAARTGKTLLQGGLDPERAAAHMKSPGGAEVTSPVLLADAERFYLFLNRNQDPNQVMFNRGGYSMVRNVPVNGVAYAFNRTTGKRLWYTETLFENQVLFLERFEDLPALVAAAGKPNPKTGGRSYMVAVLDKQLGKLRYYDGHQENSFFMAVNTDPKTRAVEFWRFDLRVRIAPDEPGGDR